MLSRALAAATRADHCSFERFVLQREGTRRIETSRLNQAPVMAINPVGIVHTPKCAGSALRSWISGNVPRAYIGPRYYADSSFTPRRLLGRRVQMAMHSGLPVAEREQYWNLRDLRRFATQHSVVMCHMSVADFVRAGFREMHVIVREPRIRLLSQFLFWRSLPDAAFAGRGEPARAQGAAVAGTVGHFLREVDRSLTGRRWHPSCMAYRYASSLNLILNSRLTCRASSILEIDTTRTAGLMNPDHSRRGKHGL